MGTKFHHGVFFENPEAGVPAPSTPHPSGRVHWSRGRSGSGVLSLLCFSHFFTAALPESTVRCSLPRPKAEATRTCPRGPAVCVPRPSHPGSSAGRRRTLAADSGRGCARDSRRAQRRSRGGGRARGLGGPNQRAPRRGRTGLPRADHRHHACRGRRALPTPSRGERRGAPAWAATRPLEAPGGARRRRPRGRTWLTGKQRARRASPRASGTLDSHYPRVARGPSGRGLGLPTHHAHSKALGLPAPPRPRASRPHALVPGSAADPAVPRSKEPSKTQHQSVLWAPPRVHP